MVRPGEEKSQFSVSNGILCCYFCEMFQWNETCEQSTYTWLTTEWSKDLSVAEFKIEGLKCSFLKMEIFKC